jgi:hypothetical protein
MQKFLIPIFVVVMTITTNMVLTKNQSIAIYATDADSIGLPLMVSVIFGTLIFVFDGVFSLILPSHRSQNSSITKFRLFSVLGLTVLNTIIALVFFAYWLDGNHWLISITWVAIGVISSYRAISVLISPQGGKL